MFDVNVWSSLGFLAVGFFGNVFRNLLPFTPFTGFGLIGGGGFAEPALGALGLRPLAPNLLGGKGPGSASLPEIPKDKGVPPDDKAVQQAVAEGSRRRKLARGFKSTILSQLVPKDATALKETIGS